MEIHPDRVRSMLYPGLHTAAGLLLLAAVSSSAFERPDLARHFKAAGAQGSFTLYDASRGAFLRYNPEGARVGHLPASTFKVLNSLIALETGVIEDENVVLPWDGQDRGRKSWNRDHDLASAFSNSAVWFYQELARRIGEERMRDFVLRVGYGNQDVSGGIDTFWLRGALRISAEEQIAFLRRLEGGDLPFSDRTMAIVRRIMKVKQGDGYVMRGKTGWSLPAGGHHGWYVGWVEKGEALFFFALEVSSQEPDYPMYRVRSELLEALLKGAGVLPDS